MNQTAKQFPEKYHDLIDEQTWEFIRKSLELSSTGLADLPIEALRQSYAKLSDAFASPISKDVTNNNVLARSGGIAVPCRLYNPVTVNTDTLILYYHGGGFMLGDLDTHDSICADLCYRTGLQLMSVDYRLTPEHHHPAAFDDCLATYLWANQQFACPIILCGDSAGANLAAAVAHASRGLTNVDHRPIGQVLIYPALGGDTSKGSYKEHSDAPLLSLADVHDYERMRLSVPATAADPTLAPLQDNDFSALPHTISFAAECDPLCSDGADYCDAIRSAGGIASNTVETGLVHGFLRARTTVARAEQAFNNICDALSGLAVDAPSTD